MKNHGFLKFIILDNELRGLGYGTKMIQFICRFAFEMTAVSSVVLNVFDANTAAVKCYQKAGFSEQSRENNVFSFQKESWGRCRMTKER